MSSRRAMSSSRQPMMTWAPTMAERARGPSSHSSMASTSEPGSMLRMTRWTTRTFGTQPAARTPIRAHRSQRSPAASPRSSPDRSHRTSARFGRNAVQCSPRPPSPRKAQAGGEPISPTLNHEGIKGLGRLGIRPPRQAVEGSLAEHEGKIGTVPKTPPDVRTENHWLVPGPFVAPQLGTVRHGAT